MVFSCKAEYTGGNYFLVCVLNGEKAVIIIMKKVSLKSPFLTQPVTETNKKALYLCYSYSYV